MTNSLFAKFFFLLFTIAISLVTFGQLPFSLVDGRDHRYCEGCKKIIEDKPAEALFGIQINENGDVYFLMDNRQWFDKIFKNESYGVTVDLVSKDRYACDKLSDADLGIPKGTMILPVYRSALLKGQNELIEGHIFTKIGKVPTSLKNKQLEGNLVILNGNYICYYMNFVNIDRSIWQLLPMGLFTDSLLNENKESADIQNDYFIYTKKIKVEIPFSKSSTTFSNKYIKNFYDSLDLLNYKIKQIEIRAYSSVEGPEKLNRDLMNRRAEAMIQAFQSSQPNLFRFKILTAENWLEFFNDIQETKFSDLKKLSKLKIKQKLSDRYLANEIEPLLAKERKVVATIYLEAKSTATSISDSTILGDFKKAINNSEIDKARLIQKEIVDRIIDKTLPLEYINKLEVPQTKGCSLLLNDREVYKYLLKATTEYEALDNFLALRNLDPENGRINYNICALRFFMWQYGGDTSTSKILQKEINSLPNQGINITLVKRMLLNFNILKCEEQMRFFDYDGKDASLSFIRQLYSESNLNDEEIYSLAKYFSFYAHQEWAEEIITPRMDKIDVNEDLVFYYLNLLFFQPANYESDSFSKAVLNAIILNKERFCKFFLPNDRGGASMQLLDHEKIKKMYCEECASGIK